MGDIRLFVSHSHEDKDIAVALVDVIEAAMVRGKDRILCTSHHNKKEYGYTGDEDVSEHLRQHLSQSSCVVSLWTPHSRSSIWCLFELGGAWALANKTYPLLAPGLDQESLPPPLRKGMVGAKLSEPEEISRFLRNLRQRLGWDERGGASAEIKKLVEVAKR